jgi:hypothetical protein
VAEAGIVHELFIDVHVAVRRAHAALAPCLV